MKFLQVLIFVCLFSKILADPNPNDDEFSESSEESFSESDEDDEDFTSNEDTIGVPEHRFCVKETKYSSGKKKGQSKIQVNLIIPPNTFSRKKEFKNVTSFICNECNSQEDCTTYAKAIIKGYDAEKKPIYELTEWPAHHECSPSPTQHTAKEFSKYLYDQVEADPLKSIPKIYEEAVLKFTKEMNADEKECFLSEIITFANIQGNLYRHRQNFIPKEPKEFADFDLSHEWFKKIDENENIIKKDKTYINKQTGKEGKIVIFTSKKLLEALARARSFSGDGTFKIAFKKLWTQIFIISAEVSKGVWVPVVFGYLPDKTFATYLIFFGIVLQCLNELKKSVSAKVFMCDFEQGIRRAVLEIFPHLEVKGRC